MKIFSDFFPVEKKTLDSIALFTKDCRPGIHCTLEGSKIAAMFATAVSTTADAVTFAFLLS